MAARMKLSPTTRTLAYLRARGYVADIAERRQGPITRDLFGVIDIVAASPAKREVLFVQVTSDSNRSSRVRKTIEGPDSRALLEAGAMVEVWTWSHERATPHITRLRVRPKLKKPTPGGDQEC